MKSQIGIYKRIQNTYHFTDLEMRRLDFTLTVFFYEISKFIILAILFSAVGLFQEYAISILVLMPIRIFSGGIHFNHYISCFLFTSVFFTVPVLLRSVSPDGPVRLGCMAICLLVTYLIGPVTSQKRPPITYKRYTLFRLISTGLLLVDLFLSEVFRVLPYENICFWVIVLQTIQLICARLARKGDIYEKNQ